MSGFYIGVDGKARKVKGGYIGIDGKARKIKKGYIGDENGAARLCFVDSPYDPVFANNTWAEIAEACHTNNVPDAWAVGDQKTMSIGGTNYTIDIIGRNHDDYSDGSGKAPLTFQLHDCYNTKYVMDSDGENTRGWTDCAIRVTHIPTILAKMPTEVKGAIREVVKMTSVGNADTTIESANDKLFLLSEIEIFGTTRFSANGEGGQYEYYASGGNTIKRFNGSAATYIERSPRKDLYNRYCAVSTSGVASTCEPQYENAISPAFCF